MNKKVLIVQKRLTQYRVDFFNDLRSSLKKKNVELNLIHGQPSSKEIHRNDSGSLDWAIKIHNKYLDIGDKNVCYQSIINHNNGYDLIILQQEASILSNYLIQLSHFQNTKIAYWGHGKNNNKVAVSQFAEFIKRKLIKSVDWWFAYTESTKKYLLDNGFNEERITVVQNSYNTKKLQTYLNSITIDDIINFQNKHGFFSNNIACYIGSLDREKKIDELLEIGKLIRQKNSDFVLLIGGDGEHRNLIINAQSKYSWLIYLGPIFGLNKAMVLKLSKIVLHPGRVGLSVLDSLTSGRIMLTYKSEDHSPEHIYLNSDNSFSEISNREDFVDIAINLLNNDYLRLSYSENAVSNSKNLSLENMVSNYSSGVINCLNY